MVSVIVVTYNSIRYLPEFMESILSQTYFRQLTGPPEVFVVDNASSDGTVKFIRDHYPAVNLLRNMRNIGLTRAWNQGLKMTKGDFVLIMNPDLILDPRFIERAVAVIEKDDSLASVAAKIYQLKLTGVEEGELAVLEKTNLLDSCGLQAFKNRRFADIGAGELDRGQYNQEREVFGPSGACAFFRRSALEKIKFAEEYYDQDFFMYKEDIDLAWRLRLAGYSSIYSPQVIAFHHRRARSQGKVSDWSVIRYRRAKDDFVNFYSYRNHWLLLYKNSFAKNIVKDLPFIFLYELKKFIYVLIFENSHLRRAVSDLIHLRKKMKKKRELIMRIRRASAEEIRGWFE